MADTATVTTTTTVVINGTTYNISQFAPAGQILISQLGEVQKQIVQSQNMVTVLTAKANDLIAKISAQLPK